MSTPTQHSTICNTPGNHMQSSPQGPNLLQDTNTLDCSTGPGLHHTALICTNNHTSRMQSCVDTYSLKVASCWWGCVCLEPQHHMSQARATSAAHTTRTQHVQYTTPHAFASHRSHQCKWHNVSGAPQLRGCATCIAYTHTTHKARTTTVVYLTNITKRLVPKLRSPASSRNALLCCLSGCTSSDYYAARQQCHPTNRHATHSQHTCA